MNRKFTRRRFLAATAAASCAASPAAAVWGNGPPKAGKTLDIHVHLFGTGDAGSGCRLSKTTSARAAFQASLGQTATRQAGQDPRRGLCPGPGRAGGEVGAGQGGHPRPGCGLRRPRQARLGQDPVLYPQRLPVSGGRPLPGANDPLRFDQPPACRCPRRAGPLCGEGGQGAEDPSADPGRRSLRKRSTPRSSAAVRS